MGIIIKTLPFGPPILVFTERRVLITRFVGVTLIRRGISVLGREKRFPVSRRPHSSRGARSEAANGIINLFLWRF